MTRRECLVSGAILAGTLAMGRIGHAEIAQPLLKSSAEHVIHIWLGGGMSQVDTFDPKELGDPEKNIAGSLYGSIETAVPGVRLCEHLKAVAPLMDRMTAVRTVHHEVIDEHASATNRMHTGRPISGTVTYPSLGSLVAHELGTAEDEVPPYVLIGYPNVTRGPGFLGARHGYLYLTDTSRGPAGLSRPEHISEERQSRRESLLSALRDDGLATHNEQLEDYDAAIERSLKLSGSGFNRVFDLDNESADLRMRYGGEFGQRCLLARRLVQNGVRFVEVSHNLNFINGAGWDVHFEGIRMQHELIRELDTAVATLITDLESQGMLDKTLIVINTEFGRPSSFDARGGRAHQGTVFSCVLAGGGLAHKGAWGMTDAQSKTVVTDPVSVPDLFATILASIGVDYHKNLYVGDRPVPITDDGAPIAPLFT
ncbi:MAG: hypothetical protein COA73_00985 [Candidatus Hydrogenedentota bacterium]|nr:MAG: hypothetical protein COA73_00985 [Candidatus Hydrogenedentota bacterium]